MLRAGPSQKWGGFFVCLIVWGKDKKSAGISRTRYLKTGRQDVMPEQI